MRSLCRSYALVHANRFYVGILKKKYREDSKDSFKRKQPENSVLFNAQQAEKISEVRKLFLGIKVNTSYLKCYNEDTFEKAMNYSGKKISQLPFHGSLSEPEHNELRTTGLTSQIFKKFNFEKLQSTLLRISQQYFSDLINKTRQIKVEPNYDRQGRRVISSLMNSNHNFAINNSQSPSIKITKVELVKGVEVTRNNNYTSDSYNVIHNQQIGIKQYKLWTEENKKLAEQQAKKQRNMLMRIQAIVHNASNLIITKENGSQVFNSTGYCHQFTFQMDLRHPPNFSSFHLTPIQYLHMYRPNGQQFVVTNIDKKNTFYSLTFNESQKRKVLINKLV